MENVNDNSSTIEHSWAEIIFVAQTLLLTNKIVNETINDDYRVSSY